jgi:hypothetical protein
MPTPRISTVRNEHDPALGAPAVVLAFPARAKTGAADTSGLEPAKAAGTLPASPRRGERPTLAPRAWRDWLRITLIVSVAVHAIV